MSIVHNCFSICKRNFSILHNTLRIVFTSANQPFNDILMIAVRRPRYFKSRSSPAVKHIECFPVAGQT